MLWWIQTRMSNCKKEGLWACYKHSLYRSRIRTNLQRSGEGNHQSLFYNHKLQGVPKVFIHLKWAVCGELVDLKFFWGNTKWNKVSYPHYLKILMKLSKHDISYSLKRDPRSISKIIFYANLRALIIFQKNAACYSSQQYLGLNEVSWMALLNTLLILQR